MAHFYANRCHPSYRNPDFRIDYLEDSFYAEVTQTDIGKEQKKCYEIMDYLHRNLSNSGSLDCFFFRRPNQTELQIVLELCQNYYSCGKLVMLPENLGVISDKFESSGAEYANLGYQDDGIRLFKSGAISVSIPYLDTKTETVMDKKAQQLPEKGNGLILVDLTNTPGGIKAWKPCIERKFFQPQKHTRISCVVLFSNQWGWNGTRTEIAYIKNKYAKIQSPDWLIAGLNHN